MGIRVQRDKECLGANAQIATGGKQHSCTFDPDIFSYGEKCVCASGYGVAIIEKRCKACDCGGLEFNCTFSAFGKTCECGKNYKEKKGKCAALFTTTFPITTETSTLASTRITTISKSTAEIMKVSTPEDNLSPSTTNVSTSPKATTLNEKSTTNEVDSTTISEFSTTPESNTTVDPNTTTVGISITITASVTTPGTNLTSTNDLASSSGTWISASDTSTPFKISSTTNSTSDVNPCISNPCQNNGTCALNGTQAICVCESGSFGRYCEYDADVCESNPCFNGGKCIATSNSTYRCLCDSGYSGRHCEVRRNSKIFLYLTQNYEHKYLKIEQGLQGNILVELNYTHSNINVKINSPRIAKGNN